MASLVAVIPHCMFGKFHFVDLAGSERAHRTGNVGDRFKGTRAVALGLVHLKSVSCCCLFVCQHSFQLESIVRFT